MNRLRNATDRLFPSGSFFRSASILASGTIVAQALLILTSPLLTRLYTPTDFGALAVYSSILTILSTISSFQYEQAIPIPENKKEAASITLLCFLIAGSIAVALSPLSIIFRHKISSTLGIPTLTNYLWLIPVGIILGSTYTILHNWAIRSKEFTSIAKSKLQQSIASIAIQVSLFKLEGLALVLSQISAQSSGSAKLFRIIRTDKDLFLKLKKEDIQKAAKRYKKLPLFTTFACLVNSAGHQLPPLLFSAFLNTATAGFYSLANRIIMAPASIVGSSVGSVFLSEAAKASREKRLPQLFIEVQDKLIRIGLPPSILIAIAGPEIFTLFFGQPWQVAGEYSRWLIIGIFPGFVASPLSSVFTITEKQQIGLILQMILFIGRTSGIVAGIWVEDAKTTIVLFSLASLFGYTLYLIIGAKTVGASPWALWKTIIKASFPASATALPFILIGLSELEPSVVVPLALSSVILLYQYRNLIKSRDK